jgi:hypothetical protein
MAGKAAGPEGSGDMAGRGTKPGPPDRPSAGGPEEPGDSAGLRDNATSADEVQSQFREALERPPPDGQEPLGSPNGCRFGCLEPDR